MKTMRQHFMLFLFLSAFLLAGPASSLGEKGAGWDGRGKGMADDGKSMEKHDGKMTQEETTMKDEGMKAGEMKKDKQNHEGTMKHDKGMEKHGEMMKSKDAMQ
jgi:hypothetical protein